MRTRIYAGLTILVLLAAHAAPASAQRKPDAQDRVLPDYDQRDTLAPVAPGAAVRAASERLRTARANTVTTYDRHTGGLRTAFAPGGTLAGPAAGDARTIGRAFLVTHAAALGLDPSDIRTLVPAREYTTSATGVRHVFWTQVVDGIPVFDSSVSVHLAADGSVLRINSNAAPLGERQQGVPLQAAEALRRAAANIRPEAAPDTTVTRPAAGSNRRTTFARGSFARDVDVSLTWIAVQGRLRLAWDVVLEPEGFPQVYDTLVDAQTGDVLVRRNRVKYADGTGRVIQSAATAAAEPRRPDPRPFGADGTAAGCPPVSNHLVRDLASSFHDPATILGNAGRLSGNNAHVYRGTVGTESALGTFDAGAWSFDFPFNTAGAAETTLFFTTNFVHDFYYDLGFDEAAGNYQVDNFGRGGAGNDPVFALARASGRNNATWEPTDEGQSPTMSMFLWDGFGCWSQDVNGDGTQDLDGDLDSDIIIHEYHHGVSLRLNTSFTGNEAGAIGEGGGDFFAYSINNDTVLSGYSYAGGIRGVNAKTYADWMCLFGLFCEVHDNGEIWANVLWDVRERFRVDVVNGSGAAAIDEAHRLYIDGLKLSPPAPSMLDMRDAMVEADAVRSPDGDRSANFCRLWESFAARGMGVAARDSSQDPSLNVVADYTVPTGCTAPPPPPTVTITTLVGTAYEAGTSPATMRLDRAGDTTRPLQVSIGFSGSASASDYVAVGSSITIPEGASSALVTITPVDDAIVEGNETLTLTIRASGAYVLGSPSSASVSIVSDDVAPDLAVSALTVPSAAAAGGTITITDTTSNNGAGGAPESQTAFYLSSDFSVGASDTPLGSRTVPALATKTSNQQTTTLIIPASVNAGTYNLLARADNGLSIAETNEYNNIRSGSIRIGPDLVVTSLSAPSDVAPGATIVVNDTVKNQGASGAGASVTRFYLSTNFQYDASDVALDGSRSVPSLDPNIASGGPTSVVIPVGTATGTYNLIARTDATGAVAEAQETNNTRYVQVRVGGDLVVSAVSGPARTAPGSTIAVTDTTRNQGAAPVGASSTVFYLSTNASVDGSDVRLDARAVPALAAGASHTWTTSLTVPLNLAAGTWNVVAKADGDSAVIETLEGNNTRYFSLQVGPDLKVSSLSAPTSAVAGSSITVNNTVTNAGAAAAGSSRVRYYLSKDFRVDASDVVIPDWRDVPELAPSGTSTGSTTFTIPATLTAGQYYLFAVADGDKVVPEAVENNNSAFRAVAITVP